MNWADYCILVVLLLSTLVGILRGFTRESFGLLTWALAIWLAWQFAHPLAGYLARWMSVPSVRLAAAAGGLFLGGLVLGSIVTHLFTLFIKHSPLVAPDRTLGAGFGLVRGIALVVIAVMLMGLTPVRQDPWWHQSRLIGPFEVAAGWLRLHVPAPWLDVASEPKAAVARAAAHQQEN